MRPRRAVAESAWCGLVVALRASTAPMTLRSRVTRRARLVWCVASGRSASLCRASQSWSISHSSWATSRS
eukprot:6903811-Alexandrium_andersonii.AAC.1